MRIYNYSDIPLVIRGKTYTDKEFFMPENYREMFVHHNGQFIGGGTANDPKGYWTHLYITQGDDGTIKYHKYDMSPPDILSTTLLLVSAVGFCLIIKIIQKIKTA